MEKQAGDSIGIIKEFFQMLEKYNDSPNYLTAYTNFIRNILRSNHNQRASLPIIEIMAIIKHERPLIFSLMRKQQDKLMYIITHVDMEVEEAKNRLSKYAGTSE